MNIRLQCFAVFTDRLLEGLKLCLRRNASRKSKWTSIWHCFLKKKKSKPANTNQMQSLWRSRPLAQITVKPHWKPTHWAMFWNPLGENLKATSDLCCGTRSGLTWLQLWQSVLPEEASCHHHRQQQEENQSQMRQLHLHSAAFGDFLRLDGHSRISHSRSLLYN